MSTFLLQWKITSFQQFLFFSKLVLRPFFDTFFLIYYHPKSINTPPAIYFVLFLCYVLSYWQLYRPVLGCGIIPFIRGTSRQVCLKEKYVTNWVNTFTFDLVKEPRLKESPLRFISFHIQFSGIWKPNRSSWRTKEFQIRRAYNLASFQLLSRWWPKAMIIT